MMNYSPSSFWPNDGKSLPHHTACATCATCAAIILRCFSKCKRGPCTPQPDSLNTNDPANAELICAGLVRFRVAEIDNPAKVLVDVPMETVRLYFERPASDDNEVPASTGGCVVTQ